MADYMREGVRREREIGNRGRIRFASGNVLAADILDAYWRHGYYVFEDVIDAEELTELRAAVADTLARAPIGRGAERPAQIAGPDRPGEAPRLVQAHRHGESPRLPRLVERRLGLHAGSR